MLESKNQKELDVEKIKSFYKDHIRQGKNFSLPVLFVVQPTPGGNGLQKLSMQDIKKPLADDERNKAIELFTFLCIELYPLFILQARKNFVGILNVLHNDPLLEGGNGTEIKDTLLKAMRDNFIENDKKQALATFYTDFPEYKLEETTRVVSIVLPQKMTLYDTLTALLEANGEREQVEMSIRELISTLVLESQTRRIEDIKQEFLLLERANAAKISLKRLALLLMSRYFYAISPKIGNTDPTRTYLVETYDCGVEEVLDIFEKKKEAKVVSYDNIKRLCGTYKEEIWEKNEYAKKRLIDSFLQAHKSGRHGVCVLLHMRFSFLSTDPQIVSVLPYIDLHTVESNSNTIGFGRTLSNGAPDIGANNLRIMNGYLREGTIAGVEKAAGLITSLHDDINLTTHLRNGFSSTVVSLSKSCSGDILRRCIKIMKDHELSISPVIYHNFMKYLLVAGKNDNKVVEEIKGLIQDNLVSIADSKKYIDELFIDPLTQPRDWNDTSFQYPDELFTYLKLIDIYTEKELLSIVLKVMIKMHTQFFVFGKYINHVSDFQTFKKQLLTWSGGTDMNDIYISSLEYLVGSPEKQFICADLFSVSDKQRSFDFYIADFIEKRDYLGIKSLLGYVDTSYIYDRGRIIQDLLLTMYNKQEFDQVDVIATQETISDELKRELRVLKVRYELGQKELLDYIGLPEIHQEYTDSPEVQKIILQNLNSIDIENRSKKQTTLKGFLQAIIPLFLSNSLKQETELKKLLAKKALNRLSLPKNNPSKPISSEYIDLYQHLQLHYGEDISEIESAAMRKWRKLKKIISDNIPSQQNEYHELLEYTQEIVSFFNKKGGSIHADQQEVYDRILLQWKERLVEIPLREYEDLLRHIRSSMQKLAKNEKLREPRNYRDRNEYDKWRTVAQKDDDYFYYNKTEIPIQFHLLLDQKLILVPGENQRKLRKETLELWFGFYEENKDNAGIDMLETRYGFAVDRIEEKRKKLLDFMQHGDKQKIEQLAELIALFGMSNAADILYQLYPDYKGLPSDEIQSILSHYLGELLLHHKGIGLHQIPEKLDISGLGLLDSLFTVIERDFVRVFTETKKTHPNESNASICRGYLVELAQKFQGVKGNHPKLNDVYTHFSDFINRVLSVEKPEKFIDELVSGREFPDFLQKLNAALVVDKKRFLIADGMGLGKSLSAILAKEHSGATSCLIVVPSLVTATRQGYLSDVNDPSNKKRGYFKPGEAPRVCTIEKPDDVALLNDGPYDYVIISQEKLQGDEYIDALTSQGFDFMIVDEIHKLKNISEGKRAGGLLRITEHIETHGGSLCLLSGTPLPNKIADIAILLKLLYPEKYAEVENVDLVNSIIQGGDMLNLRSLLLPMMQMKKLTDHIDMPELTQTIKHISLSEEEQLYYDAFVEDNTMSGPDKVMLLRKFLLNPQLAGVHTIPQSSKAKRIGEDANELFKTKNKIVFFANGFRSGVLREKEGVDKTLIEQMNLDSEIEIRIIDGTNTSDRQKIQDEFNSSDKKIALFISGSTADVGIDLTAGEHIIHINEPRTQADIDQQEARVYRFGQLKDIETTTYITSGTLEQGIHDYVIMKHQIILKLYFGLKLSDLEQQVLLASESDGIGTTKKGSGAVNTTLTKYIRTAKEKLNNMFGYLREGGFERIESLVERRGAEMAEYYALLGPRSYQANVNRMHAHLLKNLLKDKDVESLKIVDLGSGPKMLEQHTDPALHEHMFHVDINPNHFSEQDISSGKALVSNFGNLPFKDNEVDVCCSSLSFNETAWSRTNKEYERLNVLLELWRVLKPGGVAVISTIYSLQYKYPDELKTLLDEMGFELVPEYSGVMKGGTKSSFETKTLVLRKKERKKRFYWRNENEYLKKELLKRDDLKGLDMAKVKVSLSDQEYVLDEIEIVPDIGKPTLQQLNLTKSGILIQEEERKSKALVQEMMIKDNVKHITDISHTTLLKWGFGRYMNKSSCVLMKKLQNNAGLFRYSAPLKMV